MPGQLSSFLAAAAFFALLAFMRMKVFQFHAAAQGRRFSASSSLRVVLHVLGSLLVPGLGQAMRGRITAAFARLGIFVFALASMCEAALCLNLASAMEHAFK